MKIFAVLLALFMFNPAVVLAAGTNISSDSSYSGYDYLLDSYDVDVSVNEDNTFFITEEIGAWFNVPKHGIIRSIPLRNKVERLDGTVSYNRARITDISVDSPYTTSVSEGNETIKIGDPDITMTGAQGYRISYTYNLGKDTGKGYDELYLNLIGDQWDTAIGNVTFTIKMPKEFDASKLGFSRGPVGSTDSSGIMYQVSGNVITGSYSGVLDPGEALTVRLELPEGYFTGASTNFDFLMILSLVLPVLFMLMTVFMWIRFGKDEPVIETVEFYPPEGFNSAETGFIYKGSADSNDVVSLLIYLADKGYLKITEIEERSLFMKSASFKLTKLKDYDGNNENERIFLTGLFSTAKKLGISDLMAMFKSRKFSVAESSYDIARDEVTAEDLQNSFYVTLNRIVQNLNKKENRQMIFEKTSLGKGLFIAIMIIAIYVLITVKPVLVYGGTSMLFVALLFPGIGFTALFAMVFGKTKLPVKIFGVIWGLGFGGMPWVNIVLPALMADTMYLIAYILGLACVFVMVIMFRVMPKRTAYGNKLLGRIKGFRNFLETAEKPKLEELVLQDPTYFYKILPYTYVLGVSDKWIEKFEVIAMQAPDWYDGRTAFNMAYFGTFIDSTMSSASAAMSSSPSGSGGSGGGSSGGGSGGGGGSSW